MSQHEINLLLEAMLWIALILAAPALYKVTYKVTLLIWYRIFRKPYLKLTFKQGNRTYSVVVDPNTDYALELEERLQELGFK